MYILSKSNVCCVIARYVDKELNFLTRQSLFLFVITYLESQRLKCCVIRWESQYIHVVMATGMLMGLSWQYMRPHCNETGCIYSKWN